MVVYSETIQLMVLKWVQSLFKVKDGTEVQLVHLTWLQENGPTKPCIKYDWM